MSGRRMRGGWRAPALAGLLLAASGGLDGCNTGSETGNPTKGLSGSVKNQDGSPAAHTQVILVPADFNPLELLAGRSAGLRMDTTDARGRYRFAGIASGTYNLEALSLVEGTRLLAKGFILSDSVAEIPVQDLGKAGRISAALAGAAADVHGYVYILGTTFYRKVSAAAGSLILDSLPAGKVDSLVYGDPQGAVVPKAFAFNLDIRPDSTSQASGPYLAWTRSAVVHVNTTASGVKLSGRVAHFPLRIDLKTAGLDFASARADGADLRATNERGDPLPCETQLWNASAGTGQLWVRVDTLFADSLQKVRLHWGYGGAGALPAAFPPGSVFDAGDGYVAAWHLDQDPFLAGPSVPDVSGRQNEGIAVGFAAAGSAGPGVVGDGLGFDGKTQYLGSRHGFVNPGVFTFALWFRTTSTEGGRLIEFVDRDTSLTPQYWDRLISIHPDGTAHFGVFPPNIPGTPMPTPSTYQILDHPKPLNDGQWHHVAGRLSSRGQAFFVDGALVARNPAIVEAQNITGYWRIGNGILSDWAPPGTSQFYRGSVDEVWIAHAELSDDYIRLAYENQKPGTTLLKYP